MAHARINRTEPLRRAQRWYVACSPQGGQHIFSAFAPFLAHLAAADDVALAGYMTLLL